MYLEKIEIQGFKSFANKNKLVFSGILADKKRGITVIVGPNGSGKSNIADAIRWVLGEQSSKLLRSKKSEDVIFSGSDKKSRLNMAEVSLYLNNENGLIRNKDLLLEELDKNKSSESDNINALLLLPEIILTRRVFRDGGSEYFINNTKARLSDIQIFLAKANFGQKTYSVIGQGMVENFLNTSPSERKVFFDEATGVKQYQIKRDISLNRLELSQENLSKVELLFNEIEPRLKNLTRQINRLKKRKSLEEELLRSQTAYYFKIWQEISDKINSLKNKTFLVEEEILNLQKKVESDKNDLQEASENKTITEEFYDLQKKFLSLKDKKEKVNKQLRRIENLRELLVELKNNDKANNLDSLLKQKTILTQEILGLQNKVDSFSNSFSLEENFKDKESQVAVLEKKFQDKKAELSRLETWIELSLEKRGNFDLSFLNNRSSKLKGEIAELKNNILEFGEEIEEYKIKKISQEKIKEELSEKIRQLDDELRRINSEESPANLKKINESLESLIKEVQDSKKINDHSSWQKVALRIEESLKNLLNFSSGVSYKNKIDQANKDLEILGQEKNKIETEIYSLDLSLNLSLNKKLSWEKDLLEREKELENVLEKIKLNKTDDLEEAQKNKNTLELELKKIEEKLLLFKKDFSEFKKEKELWQENRLESYNLLQRKQSELSETEKQINLFHSDSFKIEARIEDLREEILKNSFTFDEAVDKNNINDYLVETEFDFLEKTKKEDEVELIALQEKIDNFNQEQENKKIFLLNLQKNINSLELEISQKNSDLNNFNLDLVREETRLEDLESNIIDDKLSLEQIKKHQEASELEESVSKESIARLKSQLEMIGGIDPEVEKEYEETKKRYDFLFGQIEDLNKTIKSLEKVIFELDTVIKNRFDLEFKVISEKFNEYFKILFNGGQAKIFPIKEGDNLSEEGGDSFNKSEELKSENPSNLKIIRKLKKYNATGLSGIDILATPPGKKISSISMLSGGERALVAIALICAIISANPAPFVVLDEVDAALDEANSERLAKILDDLSNKTQFIAISHNRATMKKANILYGVTMQNDGVSKLLSVRLDEHLS